MRTANLEVEVWPETRICAPPKAEVLPAFGQMVSTLKRDALLSRVRIFASEDASSEAGMEAGQAKNAF